MFITLTLMYLSMMLTYTVFKRGDWTDWDVHRP